MWRRVLLVVIGLQVIASSSDLTQAADSRPNIVFIFSDDHACRAVSAYGGGLNQTPNIDRLAKEGMRFDRCYVTNSICGPSRACVLTGKYSHLNGYYSNGYEFDGSQQTFPQLLRQAGYQTAIVGKWHLGHRDPPAGFDYWHILEDQGNYYQPTFITPEGVVQHSGYTTDIITRLALEWLNKGRDTNRPFMLMVQHKAPHRPWNPGLNHLSDFDGVKFPEPDNLFDDYRNRASAAAMAEMRIADHMSVGGPDLKAWDEPKLNSANDNHSRDWFYSRLTPEQLAAWREAYVPKNKAYYAGGLSGDELVRWKYQRYLEDYLACVASVDDSVGEILKYLDDSGLADNTVVIYSSDQGMFLGEHGWFDKRFMYEESLRAPLLVRWPGVVRPGSVEDRLVSNLDLAETFLELAGVAIPGDMQGRSLVSLLRGAPPQDWRDSFYYHYYEGKQGGHKVCEHYGVTTGKAKLIHYYKLGEWELFDLEKDPREMRSVYDDPGYAEVQAKLMKELHELRAELGVTSDDPVLPFGTQ